MKPKDMGPKARLPRGLADRSESDIRASEEMIGCIRRVYERYGFQPVETPLIEYTDALGKFLPDLDRPNEGVFSFRDDDEEWLSLRYDLTAPLARYVAENYDRLPKPYRSYRFGWVFRNEKPGPGRFRQFMQFDADTVGASSPAADAEMCMMAADAIEAAGIPRGQYVIKVNSRKVLDGVMEAIGVTDERQKLTVLRAIDKLDRLGVDGVRQLLGAGRKDESGDFTKGAGLNDEQAKAFMRWLGNGYPDDNYAAAHFRAEYEGLPSSPAYASLMYVARLCEQAGYGGRVRLDSSVVRGLEYYTGPVFEAELLFKVPNEQGQPVVFGSVGGGGRYDGLVGRFLEQDVPATGFSVGVSRLQAALTALGRLNIAAPQGPVVLLVLDRDADSVVEYQAMVARLREAGIAAEMYLGESGMRAQMKYADKRNAPLAIIQGEDEQARGVVQIKDLAAGKQASAAITDNKEWREERPGQVEVPEAELVEAVRRMLGAR